MSIGKLQNRGGNLVARLGGADVLKQEELSKLTPEQMVQYNQQREAARSVGMSELAARLSDAFAGRDVAGRAAARRPMIEAEKRQEEQNKLLDDAIDKSNLPQSQKDLLKSLNVQTKAQTLMQAYEPTKITTDRIRAALFKKINDFGYDSLTPNEKETLAQIQNLDPFERRTRGLSRFPGTGTGTENDVQNGYIDTGETTQDGKKIFKDKDGNRFVETGS